MFAPQHETCEIGNGAVTDAVLAWEAASAEYSSLRVHPRLNNDFISEQ